MIIKKKKTIENPENNPVKAPVEAEVKIEEPKILVPDLNTLSAALGSIAERQERRRGDRRRGYRRVDDRNLISRAQEEANEIRERAVQEGLHQGLLQAQQEVQALKKAITELLNAKTLAMKAATSDIVFIAIKTAEKIIKTEVACDETIVLNIVSEVLKEIGSDETKIIIKTNPADVEPVKNNLPKIFPFGNSNTKIAVLPDAGIESGSCKVETSSGQVDANFSTQIELIKKAFEEEL